MARSLLTFLSVVAVLLSSAYAATTTTIILKCCKHGEELSGAVDNSESKCVASTTIWKPFIYSPSKQAVISRPPSEWVIKEMTRPICRADQTLTYVPHSTYSPYVLFDIGDAVLEVGSGMKFSPGEYCADAKALLVCMSRKVEANRAAATMRPRVYRCCGENAVFHEEK